MGFNIYEDTASTLERTKTGGSDKEDAVVIFQQHAHGGGVILPGTSFNNLCRSLAAAYPDVLKSLTIPVMGGRAWEFFDANHDGLLTLDEYVYAFEELLRPTTQQAAVLRERLSNADMAAAPSKGWDFEGVKKVGIVGAGVAGLQVANLLSQAGFQVTVFEKGPGVGGVWRENYADFGLQVPKELYEFPGFPWPKGRTWSKFPPGPQVQEYIELYAQHFGLGRLCRLETAVLQLALKGRGERGWRITYEQRGAAAQQEDFDFAVVCSGMYGWPPHVPLARGYNKFKGEILHSCTFTDRKVAAGKKVVVVGGGKSAVDNAVAAAKEGTSSTLLCRESHWPVPRYLANLVPFKWGTYSRFGHSTLHASHEENACFTWLHATCTPMKWVWWRTVETMFRVQFCLPRDQVPKGPIEKDLFSGGQILTYEFRDMVRSGQASYKHGSISHFKEDSVVLTDGTELEADMVIYATGFKKSYDLFDSSVVQPMLNVEKDGLYLYRNMIPPRVPDLAFVGSEVSTFNNVLTHGLQAAWLRDVLTGAVRLPRTGAIEKQVDMERAWKRSWMPPSSARSSIWQLHMMKYHDNLCKDMGVPHKRKGWNCLGEVFAPYTAADYAGLFKK